MLFKKTKSDLLVVLVVESGGICVFNQHCELFLAVWNLFIDLKSSVISFELGSYTEKNTKLNGIQVAALGMPDTYHISYRLK